MCLGAAVLMQDIVVFLTRTNRICEVDKPITPSVRIVDGKWTDVVRAAPKRLEHDAFRCAKPSVLGHQTIELR